MCWSHLQYVFTKPTDNMHKSQTQLTVCCLTAATYTISARLCLPQGMHTPNFCFCNLCVVLVSYMNIKQNVQNEYCQNLQYSSRSYGTLEISSTVPEVLTLSKSPVQFPKFWHFLNLQYSSRSSDTFEISSTVPEVPTLSKSPVQFTEF